MAVLPIAGIAGFLYTIPSLALFSMLVTFTGFTTTTAADRPRAYTLLIFVRNIVEGVDAVPARCRGRRGMGMGRTRRFVSVELPLALPAIMASLRIATVTTIGLVTVTGLIGQGGYGSFIDEGLKRSFCTEVVVGGGLSVLMAIVLDLASGPPPGFERERVAVEPREGTADMSGRQRPRALT